MAVPTPSITVISGCAIATVDPNGTEHPVGHLVIEGSRIIGIGAGPADPSWRQRADRWVDGSGLLATPGLVNTHHHLYQWITRGYAQDETLFGWLTALYPVWAGIDEETVAAAAAANLGWLALSGCSLTTDPHYVFPQGAATSSAPPSPAPGPSACVSRLGSGIAPIADMLAAGVPVGLGVDGSASNESGRMDDELHQALLVARLRGGSTSMSARQVLSMATIGGARVLGRQDDVGSLEVGKLADVALWRVDTVAGADTADPVCTLVFGTRSPLELLLVGGGPVVQHEQLVRADIGELARSSAAASAAVARRAGR